MFLSSIALAKKKVMKNNGIYLEKVSFQYGKKQKELNNINVFISQGSFCGIVGQNGSGKTTFTYLLNGLIPHQIEGKLTGNIFIDGVNTRSKPVSFFSRKMAMVFQNPDFMIFNLTVTEEIAFGLKNFGINNIDKRINSALTLVGLQGFESRDPHTLSFGQKQKLALAAALALEPDYLVLDEPSAMLDHQSSLHLYKLLSELHQKGKTIIIVEHDTDFLFAYSQQVLILNKGSLVMAGKTKEIFDQKEKLQKLGIKIPRIIT